MYSNVPKIDLTVVEVTGIIIFCKIRIELGKKVLGMKTSIFKSDIVHLTTYITQTYYSPQLRALSLSKLELEDMLQASKEFSSFSTFDHLSRLFFCSNANLVPRVVFSYAAVMAAPKNKLDLWVFKRSAFFQSSKNISSPCVIHSLRLKTNEIIKNSTFICKFLYIGIFHFETMIDFNYSKVYNQ